MEQRAPDLPDREVEGVGVEQASTRRRRRSRTGPRWRRTAGSTLRWLTTHALGPAGRAGGVDDVGQRCRGRSPAAAGRLARRRRSRRPRPGRRSRAAGCRRRRRQRRAGRLVRSATRRQAAVLEHVGQAVGRVGRVERDVAAAGLEDGEQADDQAGAALQAQRRPGSGPTPQRAQPAGEPVGARRPARRS